METASDIVNVTIQGNNILQITLNRPKQLNALNHDVLLRLSNIFNAAKEDKSVKALLITGEGKAFCAGADISELSGLNAQQGLAFARFGQAVFRQLEYLGKPSLAAIQGYAFGGGLELALAATLRIAANNTLFGQPEIKLGVIPGFGGTKRLSRAIGMGRALYYCLTGNRFTAEDAYQWGLVSELTAATDLLTRANEILKELVALSPTALSSIITVIAKGNDLSLDDALALEAAHFGICCGTKDKQEGVNAFLEKRTAVFSGE
jgi:enoyl-CoA hydratase